MKDVGVSDLIERGACASVKPEISIQRLLEWAFARECAQLDFDELGSTSGAMPGFGMEYVLLQRQMLGCQVDGGGRSAPHDDAEVVASLVSALPVALGGPWMAARIAEHARIGRAPDWMPDAEPKCIPKGWRMTRYGARAVSVPCGQVAYVHRGRRRVSEVRCCPVTYVPTAGQIGAARRLYLLWWNALLDLRVQLARAGVLGGWKLTGEMPARMPWV